MNSIVLRFASVLTLYMLAPVLPGQAEPSEVARNDDLRPNIIHIMADDMGYGELGSFGRFWQSSPTNLALPRQ